MVLAIDRMKVDDAGGNPENLAEAILQQLPDLSIAIPVREIAMAMDISEIREEKLDGIAGALLTDKGKSIGKILVHSDSSETRKRYTIAHELGHYVNPWHISDSPEGFRCRAKDMTLEHHRPDDRIAKMEVEANQFAAELLMPSREVKRFLRSKVGADIKRILEMAGRFNVSREAAARRYMAFVDEPATIIFSKEGKIRYVKRNDGVPRLSVWNGDLLPPGSLSVVSKDPIGHVTEWNEAIGHLWLDHSRGYTVFEQTLAQNGGFRMTMLTFERDGDSG